MGDKLSRRIEAALKDLRNAEPDLAFYEVRNSGLKAFHEKDYPVAEALFHEALKLKDDPECDLHIAHCHTSEMYESSDDEIYNHHVLEALKSYKSYIASGGSEEEDYHEILWFLENISPSRVDFNPYEEALAICETATQVFYEPSDLHIRLLNYYAILEDEDEFHYTIRDLGERADVEWLLDNLGGALFVKDPEGRSLYKSIMERIDDIDEDGAHIFYSLGNYFRNQGGDRISVTQAKLHLMSAYEMNPLGYEFVLEEVEKMLKKAIVEIPSERSKRDFQRQLEELYDNNPELVAKKEPMLYAPSGFDLVTIVENRPHPPQIAALLAEYIIGQLKAIPKIANLGAAHLKRLQAKLAGMHIDDLPEKKVYLIHGSPGTGKTYTVETLSKVIKVPFTVYGASGLTSPGYVGKDTEDVVKSLWLKAKGDITATESGIIALDEIDKIAAQQSGSSSGRDVSGADAQRNLLNLIDGKDVSFTPGHFKDEIVVDTTYIDFVLLGSFAGVNNPRQDVSTLDMIVHERMKKEAGEAGIGFNPSRRTSASGMARYASGEDFMRFGMIPELMDRVKMIIYYEKLTKDELKRIITEPRDSIMNKTKSSFRLDGIEFGIERPALDLIAEIAYDTEGSARELKRLMERLVEDIEYSLPGTDVKEYVIKREEVERKLR